MNKRFILTVIICCILLSQTVKAQDPITTLQHAGKTQVFYGATSFSQSLYCFNWWDTLYLSREVIPLLLLLPKPLQLLELDIFPDSVAVKRRTTILGGLTINAGADSLHLEGLYVNGDINYAGASSINYVSVLRCRTGSINFNSTSVTASKNNCSYEECFIEGSTNFNNFGDRFLIRHCVIFGQISNIVANAVIDGNFILTGENSFRKYKFFINQE